MTTTASFLQMLAEREQAARAQAEYLATQIEQLTGQLRELEGHLSDLATTRRVILTLADGEMRPPEPPDLPENPNPAYQNILAALTESPGPVRAKDLCHRLDLGLEPKNIEGMRSKLKRLVSRGLAVESEPGLFALNQK
jgi:hypothetical protein